MLRNPRRIVGQLGLLVGLLAGSSLPAQAAGPTGGVNPCVVLAVCVVLQNPGQSPAPGSGGGSGGSAGGSGSTASCTWNGTQYPCWDVDLGYFDTGDGCYYNELTPQPAPGDPLWGGNNPGAGAVYGKVCRDTAGGLNPQTPVWLANPPGTPATAPDPGVVAQLAIRKLQFARPVPHTAPAGTALVGVPVWFWYETSDATRAQSVGPQSATVTLDGVSVTATATLDDVVWDLGYVDPASGQEATLSCRGKGAGHPYQPGLEQNPPADACLHTYPKASPATGSPAPSPSASRAAGYYLTVTQHWTVHSVDDNHPGQSPWPDLTLTVASDPIGLAVSELQVLN